MTAMRPANRQTKAPESEEVTVLDDVIEQIDQSLPLAYERCKRVAKKPPTDRLPREALAVFQDMREDPLLNKAGDDICLCTKKQKRTPGACHCQETKRT